MSIIDRTEKVRIKAKSVGRYAVVSRDADVSMHWLAKFANGQIPNPGVVNVGKLETYFFKNQSTPEAN